MKRTLCSRLRAAAVRAVCPASPTIRVWRSTSSAAHPACIRRDILGFTATTTPTIKKLLRELDGVLPEERGAAYVSVVCCVYPDGRVLTARGECRGKIGFTEQGDGGFGYDPLFLPEEYGGKRTMAQLTADEKDAISHRGKAVQEIARRIGEIKE